ncbi:tetratricopeptide repeat protein [Seongchinamella sediminis]|uniref:tetratricopeptide repeat protein n=1 Tax=Seongchinamella sediminis TaxID=2283635 RepID=UPI0013C2DBBA|nr:tetratricopeptide repeat protein [Seongchinamella sediminis]
MQGRAVERALLLDPDLAEAHVRQAHLYAYSGENDLAIDHLDRALELDPDNVLALGTRASDLFNSGERERSASMWQRVVELEPYSRISRHNLLITLFAVLRLGDVERELELLQAIHPSLQGSMAFEYAQLRTLQGRPDKVLELLPELEEAVDRLALQAMALSDLGEVVESKAALSELAEIPGARARLREGEAAAYIHRTDTRDRTTAAIREALSEDPGADKWEDTIIEESIYSPFLALGDRYDQFQDGDPRQP